MNGKKKKNILTWFIAHRHWMQFSLSNKCMRICRVLIDCRYLQLSRIFSIIFTWNRPLVLLFLGKISEAMNLAMTSPVQWDYIMVQGTICGWWFCPLNEKPLLLLLVCHNTNIHNRKRSWLWNGMSEEAGLRPNGKSVTAHLWCLLWTLGEGKLGIDLLNWLHKLSGSNWWSHADHSPMSDLFHV